MAFAIPKIEFNVKTKSGASAGGSDFIVSLASTTDLSLGMYVRGDHIPAGTTIIAIGPAAVQLSANATGIDSSFDFFNLISFEYPPKEMTAGKLSAQSTISESESGVRQTSIKFIEEIRSLNFSFLSHALYTQMDSFLKTYALYGYTFRYYDDKTTTTYNDYSLDKLDAEPKKLMGKGANEYVWEIPLKIRRVL